MAVNDNLESEKTSLNQMKIDSVSMGFPLNKESVKNSMNEITKDE